MSNKEFLTVLICVILFVIITFIISDSTIEFRNPFNKNVEVNKKQNIGER